MSLLVGQPCASSMCFVVRNHVTTCRLAMCLVVSKHVTTCRIVPCSSNFSVYVHIAKKLYCLTLFLGSSTSGSTFGGDRGGARGGVQGGWPQNKLVLNGERSGVKATEFSSFFGVMFICFSGRVPAVAFFGWDQRVSTKKL